MLRSFGGGGGGSSAASGGSDAITSRGDPSNSDVGKKIFAIISRYAQSHYPKNAQRMRKIGVVGVHFTYTASGDVKGLRVTSSSNVDSLDEGALSAVERTKGSFPKVEKDMEFNFSIKYTLNFN